MPARLPRLPALPCRKERHLHGTVLESAFQRPALLITDAANALHTAPPK